MKRFQFAGVIIFVWSVAGVGARAQEVVRVSDSSGQSVLSLPGSLNASGYRSGARLDRERLRWITSTRPEARPAQNAPGERRERGPARKVFGTIVGAAGGFFAG